MFSFVSICLSQCLSVQAITFHPFYIGNSFLVWRYILPYLGKFCVWDHWVTVIWENISSCYSFVCDYRSSIRSMSHSKVKVTNQYQGQISVRVKSRSLLRRGSCISYFLPPFQNFWICYLLSIYDNRPGCVAEWLARRTHDLLITCSSPTGASNILGQDMNLVGTLQCLPSRGRQCVPPEVDLRERTLHYETSPEIQNRGISGPRIGHVYVSAKNILKKK